jgi:hypothetical protein
VDGNGSGIEKKIETFFFFVKEDGKIKKMASL